MSTIPACSCGRVAEPVGGSNVPGLSQVSYRAGDFNSFRRALLTPLMNSDGTPAEVSLNAWQASAGSDPAVPDLGVMMAEWWAYISDILSFYNERIANEDYLRTAMLPDTAGGLVKILGYRPRPAIAATGQLAALVTPTVLSGQTVTLPRGLQFQSKPGPGQPPQTYELSEVTSIGLPDRVSALPAPNLVAASLAILPSFYQVPVFEDKLKETKIPETKNLAARSVKAKTSQATNLKQAAKKSSGFTSAEQSNYSGFERFIFAYSVLVRGTISKVNIGSLLLLGTLNDTAAETPCLMSVFHAPSAQQTANGKLTTVTMTSVATAPPAMTAENARLTRSGQSASLWSINGSPVSSAGTIVQLTSLVRQIQAGDWVVFSAPTENAAQLVQVTAVQDILGDASSAGGPTFVSAGGSGNPIPIPVLHTQLTVSPALGSSITSNLPQTSLLFDWLSVGTLVDQPPSAWNGSSEIYPVAPAQFLPASAGPEPILLADASGAGMAGTGVTGLDGGLNVTWSNAVPPAGLEPPISVYYNLLPISCGKTVAREILGSGDATLAGQSFMLAKAPVTYLSNGASYQSTVSITVDTLPWTEVSSFYGQPAGAQIFVTREDAQQNTWVDFGDGVNGARLTTGVNNVIASYRVGGGAQIPPAGKLTVIAQNYPGLQSVANPVPVSGGSDPDPAALLKEYAPRSVLAFGRAVSVFDYAAIAAQAPGVTMASASWAWDPVNDRAAVTVYVAGQPNVASSVQTQLTAASDPNRPVTVVEATPVSVTLGLNYLTAPGADTTAINAALLTALTDSQVGLFSPTYLQIGVGLFDSQIEAVCLGVPGVLAIASSRFTFNGKLDLNPIHFPGESSYFTLTQRTSARAPRQVPHDSGRIRAVVLRPALEYGSADLPLDGPGSFA